MVKKINTLIAKYEYQNKKNFRLFRFNTFFLIFLSPSGYSFSRRIHIQFITLFLWRNNIIFLGGITWGWPKNENHIFSLIAGIFFSLIGFFIIAFSNMFLYYCLCLGLLSFIAFYLFELSFFPNKC